MPEIRPFKGIRYNQSLLEDLGTVITPPYDVIGPEEQDTLHNKSPYNIIRLEYGKSCHTDNDSYNHYTRASAVFEKWLQNKILIPESQKCYYLYEQSFSYYGVNYKRHGVIAALKLTPYDDRDILPHEQTMAGPKADRMDLLKHLRTNTSPIFTLFPDPDQILNHLFSTVDYADPFVIADQDSGQTHYLWPLADPEIQEFFTSYLASQQLLIADGHHRYETALNYYQNRDQVNSPGTDFILTIMVSMKDPGLLVLPTHRLLRGLTPQQIESMHNIIAQEFDLVEQDNSNLLKSVDFLKDLAKISREHNGFGFITPRKTFLLIPRSGTMGDNLPVTLLHDRILKPLFAARESSIVDKDKISYPHDLNIALEAVLSGSADAAFILDPIAVDKVFDRASQGKVMPQKSTFFYPKLPGGLVLYHMDLS